MANILDFEKPIRELETKIAELEKFAKEKDIDLSHEVDKLTQKAIELRKEIYGNLTAWQRVMIARHPERPTALEYIELITDKFYELHGDRNFADDKAIVGGIGSIEGLPATIIGQVKGRDTKENIARNFGMPHPEGYRKALRLMKQAERFQRPIFCLIDTPGAYCGLGAEERGQGEAIARNLVEMMSIKTPIIPIVIGEGGSGGALALGIGDKVLILENSVYSVISPEGFASILWKDSSRASEAAGAMKMTATDLLKLGVVDRVIEELQGGAHQNREAMAQAIKAAFLEEYQQLNSLDTQSLLEARYNKFRGIGQVLFG